MSDQDPGATKKIIKIIESPFCHTSSAQGIGSWSQHCEVPLVSDPQITSAGRPPIRAARGARIVLTKLGRPALAGRGEMVWPRNLGTVNRDGGKVKTWGLT